jgi:hypothetical protein
MSRINYWTASMEEVAKIAGTSGLPGSPDGRTMGIGGGSGPGLLMRPTNLVPTDQGKRL